MALRGWRFFGVAGTIIAYVAGILILSIVSLNSPNPRRARAGRFVDFDNINKQQQQSSLLGKRQPLQWCTELKFINIIDGIDSTNSNSNSLERQRNNNKTTNDHLLSSQSQQKQQTNSKNQHELRPTIRNNDDKPIKVIPFNSDNKRYILRNAYEKFDDKYMENEKDHQELQLQQQQQQQQMDIKLNVEKIWPGPRINTENHKTTLLERQNAVWRKRLESEKQNQNRKLIALASFPGSGNTWLRYLLQQSTGIFTGSVYKDFGLLKSGFPGEHIFNSSVLVIKTHEWGPQAWGNFSKAILLIRDPDKSILAEFNRQSGGHVGFASPDRYKRTKGRYWQQFVTNKLWAWEQMNMQWAKNFTGDILIVYYDDLIENVEVYLRKILDFINFPINEELLSCALLRKEGIYRRKRRIMNFDPYTQEMHRALDEKRNEVYTALGRF